MKDLPILFSAPMICAILREIEAPGTGKTQTRRVLKPQPIWNYGGPIFDAAGGQEDFVDPHWVVEPRLKYAVGDRLWVRERGDLLREAYDHDPQLREDLWRDAGFQHLADGAIVQARDCDPGLAEWADDCARLARPSIHMPRWASRLTLYVTEVRVQRLQDISEADCIAEGPLKLREMRGLGRPLDGIMVVDPEQPHVSKAPRTWYRELWEGLNGPGSWDKNPWVAAYTFIPRLGNIDTLPDSLEEA